MHADIHFPTVSQSGCLFSNTSACLLHQDSVSSLCGFIFEPLLVDVPTVMPTLWSFCCCGYFEMACLV